MASPQIEIPVGITSAEEMLKLYLKEVIGTKVEELEGAGTPTLHTAEGHLQIDKTIEVFEEGEG